MATLEEACGEAPGFVCEQVFDWTGNEVVATWSEWFLSKPAQILLIVVLAWILNRSARRAILHLADRIRRTAEDVSDRGPRALRMSSDTRERTAARTETITSVLRSVAGIAIWGIAFLIVLGEMGVDLGPLIAGAGIAGVALGFGAQALVKDFLSGIFMIIEDQFGVGDIVDLGDASGTVERVGLRTTTVRDVYGTVWHVPNGQINRVGNKSQLWARALLDIGIAYDADIEQAERIMKEVADELWQDPAWELDIEQEPEVWGVEELGADAVTVRLVVQTEAASQWKVERELRRRIKAAFDEAGIEIPFSQRTVWIRQDHGADDTAA